MSQPLQDPAQYPVKPSYGAIGSDTAPYPPVHHNPAEVGNPFPYVPPLQQVPPYVNQGGITTIITSQPVVQPIIRFGDYPMSLTCPQCRAQVVTTIHYKNGTGVWLVAGVMCLLGFWLGCCLIPFCITGLKDVHHTCPSCNRVIGVCRKI